MVNEGLEYDAEVGEFLDALNDLGYIYWGGE